MALNGNGKGAQLDIFATEETQRIYLEGTDQWVEIKRELDYGEESELEGAALRGVEREVLENAQLSNRALTVIDIGKQRLLTLALYVVDWSFTHKDKRVEIPGPLNERIALMKHLKASWATKVLEVINKQREADAQAARGDDEPELEVVADEAPKAGQSGVIDMPTASWQSADSSQAGLPAPSDA